MQQRRILTGKTRQVGQNSTINSSLIVMNEKKMNVAADATAKGIVSLYNRGFVPKKSGMVSRTSKFATRATTLYDIKDRERNRNELLGTGAQYTTFDSIEDPKSLHKIQSNTNKDTGRFPLASTGGGSLDRKEESLEQGKAPNMNYYDNVIVPGSRESLQ